MSWGIAQRRAALPDPLTRSACECARVAARWCARQKADKTRSTNGDFSYCINGLLNTSCIFTSNVIAEVGDETLTVGDHLEQVSRTVPLTLTDAEQSFLRESFQNRF